MRLQEDGNQPKVTDFSANSSLAFGSVADYVQGKLTKFEKKERNDLLSQLSSLKHTEHALSTVRSGVSSLQSSLRRIRSELSDPHRAIATKMFPLSNLHRTTELLQHSIRAFRLSKKLRDLMAASGAEPKIKKT